MGSALLVRARPGLAAADFDAGIALRAATLRATYHRGDRARGSCERAVSEPPCLRSKRPPVQALPGVPSKNFYHNPTAADVRFQPGAEPTKPSGTPGLGRTARRPTVLIGALNSTVANRWFRYHLGVTRGHWGGRQRLQHRVRRRAELVGIAERGDVVGSEVASCRRMLILQGGKVFNGLGCFRRGSPRRRQPQPNTWRSR